MFSRPRKPLVLLSDELTFLTLSPILLTRIDELVIGFVNLPPLRRSVQKLDPLCSDVLQAFTMAPLLLLLLPTLLAFDLVEPPLLFTFALLCRFTEHLHDSRNHERKYFLQRPRRCLTPLLAAVNTLRGIEMNGQPARGLTDLRLPLPAWATLLRRSGNALVFFHLFFHPKTHSVLLAHKLQR
jgi:hypothetical protein